MTVSLEDAFTRRYNRRFDWEYVEQRSPNAHLPGIDWDGLALNPGWVGAEFTAVVTNVEGWYDSPAFNGNDSERALADGATWGPKVMGPRIVTISGAAAGPLAELSAYRDRLAFQAARRVPAELRIEDLGMGRVLTADVRAGADQFRHEFFGGNRAFRWQVTVTAADPLLYGDLWNQVVLTNLGDASTGRDYPRWYPEGGWTYAAPFLANTARLTNAGNADAPVFAMYDGDLTASRLTDGTTSVLLAPVDPGMQLVVNTVSLVAEAGAGQTRAEYVLPGSRPLPLRALSTSTWSLLAAGSGTVTLAWRDAWV